MASKARLLSPELYLQPSYIFPTLLPFHVSIYPQSKSEIHKAIPKRILLAPEILCSKNKGLFFGTTSQIF